MALSLGIAPVSATYMLDLYVLILARSDDKAIACKIYGSIFGLFERCAICRTIQYVELLDGFSALDCISSSLSLYTSSLI